MVPGHTALRQWQCSDDVSLDSAAHKQHTYMFIGLLGALESPLFT